MSASSDSKQNTRQSLCLVLGSLIVLGSLGGLSYSGWSFWKLWQKETHPAPAAAVPKTPGVVPAKPPPLKTPANIIAEIIQTHDFAWFVGEVLGLFVGVRVLQTGGKKNQKAEEAGGGQFEKTVTGGLETKPVKRPSAKRWQDCNILHLGPEGRQLWAFTAARGGFSLNRQQTIPAATPLPLKIVAKDLEDALSAQAQHCVAAG